MNTIEISESEIAQVAWDFLRQYNLIMAGLGLMALLLTRHIWFKQSQYAAVTWVGLVLWSLALFYGTIESMTFAPNIPGPRSALFSCAVTFVVIVCGMFYRDYSRRR